LLHWLWKNEYHGGYIVKEGNMVFSTRYSSPLGSLFLASDGERLVGLWMEGQKYFGGTVTADRIEKSDLPVFAAAKKWLDKYFAGQKPLIADLPLAPNGGAFRTVVRDILCEIPYGEAPLMAR
jgi:methylated-DNA-[protein]-cysteine S-methyltransferase